MLAQPLQHLTARTVGTSACAASSTAAATRSFARLSPPKRALSATPLSSSSSSTSSLASSQCPRASMRTTLRPGCFSAPSQAPLRAPPAWSRSYAARPSLPPGNERAKDRFAIGPFNLTAATLFLVTGAGLFIYFQHERSQVAARKATESENARVGRPRVGGPFELVMATKQGGYTVTHQDLEGAFSLVYFGFTNCPDICPEELDKMGDVVDAIDKDHGPIINPIFVSCDPARDTIPLVTTYMEDFHPRTVGLTGTHDQVKAACKSYRVYFSTPPNADPSSDYLVDHSIFFYLMDPEGRFVDAFGRSVGKEDVEKKVRDYIAKWKGQGLDIGKADLKARVSADAARKV